MSKEIIQSKDGKKKSEQPVRKPLKESHRKTDTGQKYKRGSSPEKQQAPKKPPPGKE